MQLTVVSWNILAPPFVDCDDYKSTKCSSLQIGKRRPRIHKMIEENDDADVYLLQEVTKSELARLEEKFGDRYKAYMAYHSKTHWGSSHLERNGNAILIKHDLVNAATHLKFDKAKLSNNGNYAPVVILKIAEHRIILSSVHFDSEDENLRFVQARAITTYAKGAASSSKDVIVIGGDTNDPGDTINNYMRARRRYSCCHSDKPTYFEEYKMSIDVVYLKSSVAKITKTIIPPSSASAIVEKYGSDHLPVTTVITISNTQPRKTKKSKK